MAGSQSKITIHGKEALAFCKCSIFLHSYIIHIKVAYGRRMHIQSTEVKVLILTVESQGFGRQREIKHGKTQ